MRYEEATKELFRPIRHGDLAKDLNCSVAKIRQAWLPPTARAYRKPPPKWEEAVAEIAYSESLRLGALYQTLRKDIEKRQRLEHRTRQKEPKATPT